MSQYQNHPVPPQKPLPAAPPAKTGMSAGTIVLIVLGVLLLLAILAAVVLGLLLYPAVSQVRDAARQMDAANRVRQVSIAIINYHDSNKRFPPAYSTDENGNQLHSWRTQILPYTEQDRLVDQIDFRKPWNDPVNRELLEQNVPSFESPRCQDSIGTNLTAIVAVVDVNTVIGTQKMTLESIPDGASNTGVILEIPRSNIPWGEPRDITIDEAIDFIKSYESLGGLNVGMADGSVRAIPDDASAESIRNLFDCRDGEVVNF